LSLAFDVIVIGGGAAGLFCAGRAGQRGRRVAVLEHSRSPGRKILISGGGRCNFTNSGTSPTNFLSCNPHFAKSALARYTPADFVALVEKHRISWHEKKLGQLFCDRSAQDILDMLLAEAAAGGVQIFHSCRVDAVRRGTGFVLDTLAGEFTAPALVIASGGLSIPKAGATPFGYEVARQFGLRIEQTRPALVPLVLQPADRDRWCELAGVALDVRASFDGQSFSERMLITHRGLSGPAILQISSYWDGARPIPIDLLPDEGLDRQGNRSLENTLALKVPKRFATRWLQLYPERSMELLEQALHEWRVTPSGTEGYAKAEVTAGGVSTDELSSKTMESRKVPGLFFIGEVVDVTGHLGGYNFQWAWASAAAAAEAL
jgi:predicted Rossmann fold flavoprotein